MSFLTELKRRNVFRVGAAYLVVAWLLLQIVDTLTPILSLPDAFGRIVFMVLLIGFPIALIVSWVFELTPAGIQTQSEADQAGYHANTGKLNVVIIAGLALALVLVVLDAYVLNDDPASEPEVAATSDATFDDEITRTASLEKSLAVLPFSNLSSDPEQEYFADGLTEELLNKLAQVNDLLVAGRTSSFYYKGRNEDLRTIGEQLDVNFLLEGSVRKAGDSIRITAQLIQADNGFHLWSDTYDRSLEDIFAIQDEISEAVTQALSITLRAGEFDQPGMTNNVAAYDAFMQARALRDETSFASIRDAIAYAQEAVTLDPQFGQGWLLLAQAYDTARFALPVEEIADYTALRNSAFEMATSLSPDLLSIRIIIANRNRNSSDWINADRELQLIYGEEDINNGPINLAYGNLLRDAGYIEESLPYYLRAKRFDPLNPDVALNLARAYHYAGRQDDAIEEIQRGLAMGPSQNILVAAWWMFALDNDDVEEAVRLTQVFSANPVSESVPLGESLLENIAQRNFETILDDMAEILESQDIGAFQFGGAEVLTLWAGGLQLSLEYYKKGKERNSLANISDRWSTWLGMTSALRQTPEFKTLLEEGGVVDYWRYRGEWPDYCRPMEGNDDFECF